MLLNHFVELLLNYCDNRPCSPRSVGFLCAHHVLNNGRIQLTPLQVTMTRRLDSIFLVRFWFISPVSSRGTDRVLLVQGTGRFFYLNESA